MAAGADGGRDDLARWVDGLVEGRRGWLAQKKRERWVFGIPASGLESHWVKRGWGSRRRELRREAENARHLAELGLGPPVVASGAHGGSEWLVTEDAGGSRLRDSLGGLSDPVARRGMYRCLAAAVRRLHDAGLSFPDMTAQHTFFRNGREGRYVGVWWIDPARLERSPRPAAREQRARDLAALLASLRRLGHSRTDRVRLVRDSTGWSGDELRALNRAIDARIARLASRTRWRHEYTDASHDGFVPALRSALCALGESAFSIPESFWRIDAMDLVRTLPDRENRTLGRRLDGRPMFFIKVFPPTKSGWSPAMLELAAIDRFQRAGILVNRVAAYAEDVDKGSMVAVKACDGEPLDDFLRRTDAAAPTVAERRALAVQTAQIWRRMRECGLRHRDAYPCHLFVARTDTPLRFELRLIDMTRAGEAPWPKERWFVKDAAALWHGCPKPPVTRTDAVRWLREYFRVPKLTREAKRFARKVAAKERSIATRQARKARKAREATARGAAGGAGRP